MARIKRRQPAGDPTDLKGFLLLMAHFLEWMRERGYSERTVGNRKMYLEYFIVWCEDRGLTQPHEITPPILERYQRYLYHYRKKNGRPLTFRSQEVRLVAVRSYFKFLARKRYTLFNPAAELELPRTEQRLPKHVLTASEVELILNGIHIHEGFGLRDRAIVETFYSTGIRRSELLRLELYDFDAERGTIFVRQGKGKKDRYIPIGERAIYWVERYINELRPKMVHGVDPNVLFLNKDGQALCGSQVCKLVRTYVQKANTGKSGSCHLFRHTMATLMLEGGADIRYIQAMLGHADLNTTQIYTQVSVRKLQEIHRATHPGKLDRVPKRVTASGEVGPEPQLLTLLAAEAEEETELLDQSA